MKVTFVVPVLIISVLSCFFFPSMEQEPLQAKAITPERAPVQFEILDVSGKEKTPVGAMICLVSLKDNQVRLPPDGRILKRVGSTQEFYKGIDYRSDDRDWIGPVRKMNGKGDNNDRSYVYGLIPSVPHWKEPIAHQVKPQFNVSLEPGKYRISVYRGMEFVPVRKEFTVKAGESSKVQLNLKRWIDLPSNGWYSGDVHVHHPTMKKTQRDYLLSYAEAEDLHVVNVLEMGHHRGTDFHQQGFGKKFRVSKGNYALVSGQEDPRSTFGHIIGLNLSALARDLPTYDFYDLAFKRIHAQKDALVGFAHFSWNGCDLPRGFPWYITTEAIDFIELMQFAKVNRPDYYDYLNLGFRLTAAAGSDIPWGSTLGECRTYVYTGKKTLNVDDWFEGLSEGRTFVSNGPALSFMAGGKLPGTEYPVKKGTRIKIQAKVQGHADVGLPEILEITDGNGLVKKVQRTRHSKDPTLPPTQDSLELVFDYEVKESGWITASTRCSNGALAHTTPVYLIVDGRPTWSRKHGPRLIEKQLASIKRIENEFSKRNSVRAKGVLKRLEKAKEYYAKLLKAMSG